MEIVNRVRSGKTDADHSGIYVYIPPLYCTHFMCVYSAIITVIIIILADRYRFVSVRSADFPSATSSRIVFIPLGFFFVVPPSTSRVGFPNSTGKGEHWTGADPGLKFGAK